MMRIIYQATERLGKLLRFIGFTNAVTYTRRDMACMSSRWKDVGGFWHLIKDFLLPTPPRIWRRRTGRQLKTWATTIKAGLEPISYAQWRKHRAKVSSFHIQPCACYPYTYSHVWPFPPNCPDPWRLEPRHIYPSRKCTPHNRHKSPHVDQPHTRCLKSPWNYSQVKNALIRLNFHC